jgi:hypothetical protein
LGVVPDVWHPFYDRRRNRGFSLYVDSHQGRALADAIGGLGLFLAMLGVYLGFAVGETKGK